MGVNTHLTTTQWTTLIALLVITMFPFALAPMEGSLGGFFLGLPTWFWVIFAVAIVMYSLVVIFIEYPGKGSTSQEEQGAESDLNG